MEEILKLILEKISAMETRMFSIENRMSIMESDIKDIKADVRIIKGEVNGLNGFTTNADILKNLDLLTVQHAANH